VIWSKWKVIKIFVAKILNRQIHSTNSWTHPYFLQPIRFHAFIIFSSFIFSQFSSGSFSSFTSSPLIKAPSHGHMLPWTTNHCQYSFYLFFVSKSHTPKQYQLKKKKSKKGKRIQSSSSTMRFLNFWWRKLRLWDW